MAARCQGDRAGADHRPQSQEKHCKAQLLRSVTQQSCRQLNPSCTPARKECLLASPERAVLYQQHQSVSLQVEGLTRMRALVANGSTCHMAHLHTTHQPCAGCMAMLAAA